MNQNTIVLDEWDTRFIAMTKSMSGGTLKDYVNLWADRCGIDSDDHDIPKYMVFHFIEILMKAQAHNINYVMHELLKNSDPKGIRYCNSYLGYWETFLMNIAGQLAVTKVEYLGNYVALKHDLEIRKLLTA